MTRFRIAVAALAGAAAVAAPSAFAHTDIDTSTPRAGSTVAKLPGTITVQFESLVAKLRSVTVTDASGKDHVKASRIDPKSRSRVLITTKNPKAGRYTVTLRITGADGHTVTRGFTFRARG